MYSGAAMSMPGTIVLRPIEEFTQPDYSVIYKDPDGRSVGRIYRDTTGTIGGATPWFWTVEHHQRQGRVALHQGRCDTLDEAKAAWRRCWIRQTPRYTGPHQCAGRAPMAPHPAEELPH